MMSWIGSFLLAVLSAQASALDARPAPETIGWFDGRPGLSLSAQRPPAPRFLPDTSARRAPAWVRVLVEVKVMPACDIDRQAGLLSQALESIRRGHGFLLDESFAPAVLDDKPFRIMPYPPAPRAVVYLVRGFLLDARAAALGADKTVRKATLDTSSESGPHSDEVLTGFADRFGDRLAGVAGVSGVGLGWDCAVRGEHQHVVAHRPALTLHLAPGADRAAVREQLLKAVPELVGVRHVLVRTETVPTPH